MNQQPLQNDQVLFADIRQLIEDARLQVSQAVSSGVTALYWNIGNRVQKEALRNQRAEYGKQIAATIGTGVRPEF